MRVACCKAHPHLGSLGIDCDQVTLQRVREQEVGAAAAAATADAVGGRTGGAESIERELSVSTVQSCGSLRSVSNVIVTLNSW